MQATRHGVKDEGRRADNGQRAAVRTATVLIPNRRQVRMTRHAISPRLAINTLAKVAGGDPAAAVANALPSGRKES